MHRPIATTGRLAYLLWAATTALVVIAFAAPQELTIPTLDASKAGSPIKLSGSVFFTDEASGVLRYSFRTRLTATNVSSKSVLAVVTMIRTRGTGKIELHNTRKDDYFFRSETLEPNASVSMEEIAGPFGEPTAEIEGRPSTEPKAVAAVTFVQFADGSTWGDKTEGQDLLLKRRPALAQLKLLAEIYQTQGEEPFVGALNKPSSFEAIASLQQLYVSSKEAAGVLKRLTHMIKCAEEHERAMENQM
jgi:hypothetical protein